MDDIAADNVNKNSSDEESVDSYLEEFHHWTEDNTKIFRCITISKKEFGLVWIADAKKQELTFLKLHPYKSLKFPHSQEHLGILTTFRKIHYNPNFCDYRAGFEELQFYKLQLQVALDLSKQKVELGLFNPHLYWYIGVSEYLDLQQTQKHVQTGFTFMK
jgi:hypothetical protein